MEIINIEDLNFGPNSRKKLVQALQMSFTPYFITENIYICTYVKQNNFATKFQIFIVPIESQKCFEN